jgi:hypothetical protein
MPRLSKIGAAALAAFGWTSGSAVTASYLVVAGGGAGAQAIGGGGGAGGYQTGTTSLNPTLSYTVTVGAGGAGIPETAGGISGNDGSNSVFNAITSIGGGGGGAYAVGRPGGSGGGGGISNSAGGAGTVGQGNNGGTSNNSYPQASGGGGGAGAVGANASGANAGAGGNGLASSISGTSVTYAGGGGGSYNADGSGSVGAGGSGGGTAGGNAVASTSAAANTGGGSGGGGYYSLAGGNANKGSGNGGSGIVIISYVGAQQFGGGVVTSSGGNTIHTFTTSGTLSPLNALTANFLVVAGGGGGGGTYAGGGGGAGGFRSGTGTTIDTNSIYVVTVGSGGAGGAIASGVAGSQGGSSSVFGTTSAGGGGGGTNSPNAAGTNGGSGGGGVAQAITAGLGNTPATSPSQGNNGGTGVAGTNGSGGGGAGAVGGQTSDPNVGGNGGAGSINPITGSITGQLSGGSYYLAGGGAGGGFNAGGTGGLGGGGNGSNGAGSAGTANTGGGGGGSDRSPSSAGGAGGSGVVIISYPGSTQQMAGGTVTVAGGNVIHTFTSSGYLTPIVLTTNSLRFRKSASGYLSRTMNASSTTYTVSAWVKRGLLSGYQYIFASGPGTASDDKGVAFDTSTNQIYAWNGSSQAFSSGVYRDPAAWYHVVMSVNSGTATVYVNNINTGISQSSMSLGTYGRIGRFNDTQSGNDFDGYMAEFNLIDGQALTPNSFGTSNGLGVWQPIRYGGSYGTNGFYLPFSNTTSTTTLGYDFSPNGNNWTTNNISLTAGTTYDSMTDVPTLTSATTANYGVYNPLNKFSSTTITNGNLLVTNGSSGDGWSTTGSTFAFPQTGKWYAEFTIVNRPFSGSTGIGIVPSNISFVNQSGDSARFAWGRVYFDNSGIIGPNNASVQNTTQAPTYTTGDIISVAFDSDNGTVWWAKNGTWTNSGNPATGTNPAYTGLTATAYPMGFVITSEGYSSSQISGNWGQLPFTYTPPSGFVRMNTFNIANPTIGATASTTANKYFDATLYTGNGTSLSVTNIGLMQPDFVWIKQRNGTGYNMLFDSVRGVQKWLTSNDTLAETTGTDNLSAFNSNGFTVLDGGFVNPSSGSMVGWQWRASNATAVTNTQGSINSSVSASTTAGFSIVTYTGNATAGATVGHGLGVAPSMMIFKTRNDTGGWLVWHTGYNSNQAQMLLNSTAAIYNPGNGLYFNSTYPSSTVATLGTSGATNGSGTTYVAYMFAQIAGYSAFGSYTGNGSTDGPFIFTGFRPRYVMFKRTDSTANWYIYDAARNTYNATDILVAANNANPETSPYPIDFLSNGIKLRSTLGDINASGGTFIYMAFAESPFKYANAR